MAASAYQDTPKEVENRIFRDNRIFRHTHTDTHTQTHTHAHTYICILFYVYNEITFFFAFALE